MTESTEPPQPKIYPPTNGGRPRTRWERIHVYRLLWIISVSLFVVDLLTKLWVVKNIPFNPYHDHDGLQDITIIPGFFYLIHVGNTGAAWSILSGKSTLLAMLALGTLVAIFFYRRTLGLHVRSVQISFGLLCGGIVGNLVDRLAYGHVVDFIDFHFNNPFEPCYPTFNIADCGICIGVILYLWHSWRTPQPK